MHIADHKKFQEHLDKFDESKHSRNFHGVYHVFVVDSKNEKQRKDNNSIYKGFIGQYIEE